MGWGTPNGLGGLRSVSGWAGWLVGCLSISVSRTVDGEPFCRIGVFRENTFPLFWLPSKRMAALTLPFSYT